MRRKLENRSALASRTRQLSADAGEAEKEKEAADTGTTGRASTVLQGSVAWSCCTPAHPLHTSFTNMFGAAVSDVTVRPNPTMRLEISVPFSENLNGKRQSFPGEQPQISKRIVGGPRLRGTAHPLYASCTNTFGAAISDAAMRPDPRRTSISRRSGSSGRRRRRRRRRASRTTGSRLGSIQVTS